MQFAVIHTTAGLDAMHAADSASAQLELTEIAVGDGGGAPITPTEDQTALVGEVFRSTVNRVYKPDPTNQPALITAELVVPATEGGFTMREVGVFLSNGDLFAIGNLPETYKPAAAEGAFADTVVRMEFIATNTDTVTLQIDANVIVATQGWVVNNIEALPPGGAQAQVLTKATAADFDVEWTDPGEVSIIVNTIEETQDLADGQTEVVLTEVTVTGLAVYLNGERLAQGIEADEWQWDQIDPTRLTLNTAATAGDELILVQNEPAAGFPDALLRDQNLADVPDKPLARDNLGVPSFTDLQSAVPPGAVLHFARLSAPTGWLVADGREVDRTTQAALFDAIGTLFGAGNGVDTFNLPDLRAEFIRGHDQGRGIDSGRALGTAQADAFRSHTHVVGIPKGNDGDPGSGGASGGNPAGSNDVVSNPAGGAETRPRNIALLACIKT